MRRLYPARFRRILAGARRVDQSKGRLSDASVSRHLPRPRWTRPDWTSPRGWEYPRASAERGVSERRMALWRRALARDQCGSGESPARRHPLPGSPYPGRGTMRLRRGHTPCGGRCPPRGGIPQAGDQGTPGGWTHIGESPLRADALRADAHRRALRADALRADALRADALRADFTATTTNESEGR
jgi:hypothetical protein